MFRRLPRAHDITNNDAVRVQSNRSPAIGLQLFQIANDLIDFRHPCPRCGVNLRGTARYNNARIGPLALRPADRLAGLPLGLCRYSTGIHDDNVFEPARCGMLTDRLGFEGRLDFEVKLLSYKGDTRWIDKTINQAYQCLNKDSLPDPDPNCVPCQYISTYNEMVISHNQFEQRPAA